MVEGLPRSPFGPTAVSRPHDESTRYTEEADGDEQINVAPGVSRQSHPRHLEPHFTRCGDRHRHDHSNGARVSPSTRREVLTAGTDPDHRASSPRRVRVALPATAHGQRQERAMPIRQGSAAVESRYVGRRVISYADRTAGAAAVLVSRLARSRCSSGTDARIPGKPASSTAESRGQLGAAIAAVLGLIDKEQWLVCIHPRAIASGEDQQVLRATPRCADEGGRPSQVHPRQAARRHQPRPRQPSDARSGRRVRGRSGSALSRETAGDARSSACETSHGVKTSSDVGVVGGPGDVFVVEGVGLQAAVEYADESVGELA